MNMVKCPSCMINLTAQEAKGAKCPICGESLAALSHSSAPSIPSPYGDYDAPNPSAASSPWRPASTPVPATPVSLSQTASLPTRSATPRPAMARSSSGGKSTWWIWIVVFLAAKGAFFGLRAINSDSHNSNRYDYPSYNQQYESPYDSTSSPYDGGSEYVIPRGAQTLPDRYPSTGSPWDDSPDSPSSGPTSPYSGSPGSTFSGSPYSGSGRATPTPGSDSPWRGGSSLSPSPYRSPSAPSPPQPGPFVPTPGVRY